MLTTISIIVAILVGICTILGFVTTKSQRGRFWGWLKDNFTRFVWRRLTLVVVAIILVAFSIAWFVYRNCCPPEPKSITGYIYYLPCENSPGRDPAPNVTVFLSDHRDIKSEPTGADGLFVIMGIPPDFQPSQLTAQFGGQDFPITFKQASDYSIIPRECPEARDIRQIDTPWKPVKGECLTENAPTAKVKRYLLDAALQGEQGKKEAVLTVELLDAVDTMILNAFVLSPSPQFYRNETVSGQDRTKAHAWAFTLPKKGLRIKLEVCLGSNDAAAVLSKERIHTYYELR